jgi:biotin operon repressor
VAEKQQAKPSLVNRLDLWQGSLYRVLCLLANTKSQMVKTGVYTMTNQNQKILTHLRATKGLTLREAMLDYSIQSFTKRISELRKAGYRIDGVKGKHPVTGQQYTRYVLIEETS